MWIFYCYIIVLLPLYIQRKRERKDMKSENVYITLRNYLFYNI